MRNLRTMITARSPLGRFRNTLASGFTALAAALAPCAPSAAQSPAAAPSAPPAAPAVQKMKVGISAVRVNDALRAKVAAEDGSVALGRVTEGVDSQLRNALLDLRKFDLVTRSNLKQVIEEQNLRGSGNVDPNDPAAQAFKLAGCNWVVVTTVNDFQKFNREKEFASEGVKRYQQSVRVGAVVELVDTTTGRVVQSVSVQDEALATNFDNQGERTNGSAMDWMINQACERLCRRAACAVSDKLLPPKVLTDPRDGTFMFSGGGCAQVGQLWRVFALGEQSIDPDTGDTLREEVEIGTAAVTDTSGSYPRAKVEGTDRGVAKGCIMRPVLDPEGKPAMKPGTSPANAAPTPGLAPPPPGLPPAAQPAAPQAVPNGPQSAIFRAVAAAAFAQSGAPAPAAPSAAPAPPADPSAPLAPADAKRTSVAIFVKDRVQAIPPEKTAMLTELASAQLGGAGYRVVSREDIQNAVARFARTGPNAGGGAPGTEEIDRIVSDSTNAVQLAREMGADYLFIVGILQYVPRNTQYEGNGIKTDVQQKALTLSWKMIDAGKGATVDGGEITQADAVRQTQGSTVETELLDGLLRGVSARIVQDFDSRVAAGRVRTGTPASAAQVQITVECTMGDMTFPEFVRNQDGTYGVKGYGLMAMPLDVDCQLDGRSQGTAPGTFTLSPGIHKLRLVRPGYEEYSTSINVRPEGGQRFRFALRMTPNEMARWRENTALLQQLKQGAQLTEAQVNYINGLSQFFRQSGISIRRDITIDSNQVPQVEMNGVNGGFIWPW